MPLVTAQDFPAIFAQPDNSGIARGIENALFIAGDVIKQNQQTKIAQTKARLQTAALQLMEVRDISGGDPVQAFQSKRRKILELAKQAQQAGEDDSVFLRALEYDNIDKLDTYIIKTAQDALTAEKRVDEIASRLGFENAGETKLTPGAGRYAVDSAGNKFAVTPITNRSTGETGVNLTPIGHNNPQDGPLKFLNTLGQTAESKIEDAVSLKEQTEEIETEAALEREKGKKEAALKWNARIADKVKEAEATAKARGEALTDLARMEATLPELKESVQELYSLSEIATYTMVGRVFDAAVRETGFGETEGGTARAKFISIVDNQVLPLLRETFGAAFTKEEGDRLRATLGDPNRSTEGKKAALDAFIEQKERNIRSQSKLVDSLSETEQPNPYPEGTVIVNPSTQERMIMRDGQWQKM